MAKTDQRLAVVCKWCGFSGGLECISEHVHISNAQVTMEHAVGRCPDCGNMTAFAQWGRDVQFSYKALEYKRWLRRSAWVAIYDVQCVWCDAETTSPVEINITVANPVSQRFRYDLYHCQHCDQLTAISYLGEVRRHRAVRDDVYSSLWYLDPDEL
jgi:hypothetical protein